MDPKVYISRKKYTLADGTVKYCETKSTYKPVDRTNKVTKTKVIEKIKTIKDPEKLKQVEAFLNTINGEEPIL